MDLFRIVSDYLDKYVILLIGAIFASSGFWSHLSTRQQIKREKEKEKADLLREESREKQRSIEIKMLQSATGNKLLLGLAHDVIYSRGEEYIKRGSITTDEYENLVEYLYEPYAEMGGNGTGKKIIDEVKKLPIK